MKKIVNGVEVDMTQAEIDEYNQRQQDWEALAGTRLVESITKLIDLKIETVAKEKKYSGCLSIATYVNSTNATWKAEADAFVAWRDDVWEYAIAQLELFENDEREVVSADDFINELPAMVWPE